MGSDDLFTYKSLLNAMSATVFVGLLYYIIFVLFLLDIVPSFLITEKAFSPSGLFLVTLYYFFFLLFLRIGQTLKLKIRITIKDIIIGHRTVLFLMIVLIAIGTYGLYMGAIRPVGITNVFRISTILLFASNQYRYMIVWGKGFTILTNIFPVIMLYSWYYYLRTGLKSFMKITITSFLLNTLTALLYSARLKLVMSLILILLPYLRMRKYNMRVENKVIIVFLFMLFLAILLGGIRGVMSGLYQEYTSDPLLWTVSSFTDYFVSTMIFNSFALEQAENFDRAQVALRIGTTHTLGYTNAGRFQNVFAYFGYLSPLFFAITGLLYGMIWRSFHTGDCFGLLFYPYVYYFMLEGFRIEPLLVADFQFQLLCIFTLYHLKIRTSAQTITLVNDSESKTR